MDITEGNLSRPLAETTKGAAGTNCSPLPKTEYHGVHHPLLAEMHTLGMKRLPQKPIRSQALGWSEPSPPKGCACFWGASCRSVAGVQGAGAVEAFHVQRQQHAVRVPCPSPVR